MRRTLTIAICLAASMLGPGSVSAGHADQVDPAIMQPPLNPTFAPWDCWRNATGIICDGERTLSWENEPTFIVCDGRPVYETGNEYRTLRRYGDADGLALRAQLHFNAEGILTMKPDGSGPYLRSFGRFEETYHYLVPGDLSSRTDRYTGVDVSISGPGVGLVLHDVGIKTFDIDDNVLLAHGPHPLLADFDGTFAKVCDAFAELGA